MTSRAFPAAPVRWTNLDGTLTPEARRFLHSIYSQLGGDSPLDATSLASIIATQEQLDATLFYVMALP